MLDDPAHEVVRAEGNDDRHTEREQGEEEMGHDDQWDGAPPAR